MKACTAFTLIMRAVLSLIFSVRLGGRFPYPGKFISKKKNIEASKGMKPTSVAQLGHSHALSVCVYSKRCVIRSHVRSLTIGPLRQKTSIVVDFRPAVIAWLPALVHMIPNHNFWIGRVCKHTPATPSQPYSLSRIFSLLGPFPARVPGTAGIVFAQNMEVRNRDSHAMVKGRQTWRNGPLLAQNEECRRSLSWACQIYRLDGVSC